MTFFKTTALLLASLCIIINGGCKKMELGHMSKAGLAITFDDYYVADWYKYIDFFDSAGVKLTFYISNYNRFTEEQKWQLRKLQDRGHEVAYHSLTHADFVKYMQTNTMARLEREEINKGMEMMAKDGFHPITFAYPFGSHSEVLDNCLLRKFKSIRFLNGTYNYAKSFTTDNNNAELYAMGLDVSSGKTTQELISLVQQAKENDNCLVLVGHHLERPELKMQVPIERLRAIIKTAKDLGMEFYTVSQISRK